MSQSVQITYRHMDSSIALEQRIHKLIDRLERFASHIVSCRVLIEAPSDHHVKGGVFVVKLDIVMPGRVIAISSHHSEHPAHTDVYAALSAAFDLATRAVKKGDGKVTGQRRNTVTEI